MKESKGLRWIVNNSKGYRVKIIALSLFNVFLALATTSLAVMSKYAIDSAQKAADAGSVDIRNQYIHMIIVYGIVIFCIIIGRLFLRVYNQSLAIRTQAGLEMEMRSDLFSGILEKRYEKINEYHSGELMNRITSDIKIISDGMTNIIPDLIYYVTQFVGAFVVLVSFDWKFTLVFLVGGLLVSTVTLTLRKRLKNLHKEVQSTDGKVRSFYQEAIESLLVVKTFGVEERFSQKGDELQQINYRAKMKRRNISILANAGFSFVFNAGYLFALVWCALHVCWRTMSYGTLTAVLQLVSQLQMPFVNVTRVLPQYYAIVASAERIIEIENIEKELYLQEKINVEETYARLKEIRFENIQFNYGRESVLEEGNASLKKGDFVAIRGISGIGKSTLMKMLLGVFDPKAGNIRLYYEDGSFEEAGTDTRGLFSYVPQGNYLFSGTLRENILMVNPDATDEEISEALQLSDIADFVKTLPDGLDTTIGEKGLGISEGQAQRLAIARAILSRAPIILLDEATSALDAKTEERVLENIQRLQKKTCIIITHKNAALQVCNREFVIDNKKLRCTIR